MHVRRRASSLPLGYPLGYRGAERPLRADPKRPLTCTNMVGDTGIEPVTSSVSGTGNASAEVRPCVSVQVSRRWARRRTSPDGGEHDAVGVRVGVRVVRGDRWHADRDESSCSAFAPSGHDDCVSADAASATSSSWSLGTCPKAAWLNLQPPTCRQMWRAVMGPSGLRQGVAVAAGPGTLLEYVHRTCDDERGRGQGDGALYGHEALRPPRHRHRVRW